jgi:flagellar hook-associated protein 2
MATSGVSLQSLTGSSVGLDVNTIVAQLVYAAQAPERVWQSQQQVIQVQTNALTHINSSLSTLLTDIQSLTDATGAIGAVTATSSDSSLVTATATNGATLGSHLVVVKNLASTSSYYSDTVASGTTPLSTGSFSIQVGSGAPTTITIDNTNNTMNQLAATINNANLGVTANVVTDSKGVRLSLVANASGAANNITISNDTSGLGLTPASAGKDASLTVDGVPVSSATNSVSGVVPNVTFNLNGASPNTQVTITMAPDTQTIAAAVNTFVKDYNTAVEGINAGYAIDQTAGTAGALIGDSTGAIVQQQLLDMSTFSVSGAGNFNALSALGISTANDGTLTVDSTKLNNAINSDFANFQKFFQGSSGFGTFFSQQLTQMTDPTQGALSIDLKSLQSTKQSLGNQISDLETYIATERQQWTKQYEQANIVLQQLPQLEKQIAIQLGTYSTSSGK